MATVFNPPNTDDYNTVDITDIDFRANDSPSSTIDFDSNESAESAPGHNKKSNQLKIVDDLFGPIKIGTFLINRLALDALGATLNGHLLDGKNTFFRNPKRSFVNALQFSPVHVQARMQSSGAAGDYALTTLLFEMASQRPSTAPPLLRDDPELDIDPENYRRKLDQLLKSAQKLDIRHSHLPHQMPHWVNRVKSSSMAGMGVGLQAFGIYSGLRGLQDAISKKTTLKSYSTVPALHRR